MKRELMDGGVSTAPRVHGWFPNEDADDDTFALPLWMDNGGWLRLGLPKVDPQHAGDIDQVALTMSDVLRAIGSLLDRSRQEAVAGTALDALKAEMREQERHRLLKEIDGWLLDQAEQCDVDGAEWDAAFYRKVGQDLAELFKPC